MTQHTPLPWKVNKYGTVTGPAGTSLFSSNEKTPHATPNAEFIVRACNSHYELLEALEDFMVIAAQAKPNCGPKLRALIQAAQEKHSAAIAKARGE